jgi:acetyl-CoA synthetase
MTKADEVVEPYLALYGAPDANVARLLCDQHPADAVAYTVVEADLSSQDLTYGGLRTASEQFARALGGLDVGPGDRVATLMGKSTDYLVASMGIWRLGAVQVPLFTAFAPPAIELRVIASQAKAIVCDLDQRAKLDGLPSGGCQIITSCPPDEASPGSAGDLDFAQLIAS